MSTVQEKTIISTNAGDGGNAHSEYFGPLAEQGIVGSLIVLTLVIVTVYCGLRAYKRCRNKQAKVLVLGATLAFISYFIHGFLNNFMVKETLSLLRVDFQDQRNHSLSSEVLLKLN